MPNPEIEYFKRFAKSYLRWSHFNMDKIVADIIRKDAEAEAKRKEDIRLKDIRELFLQTNEYAKKANEEAFDKLVKDAVFYGQAQWTTNEMFGVKRIKPEDLRNLKI